MPVPPYKLIPALTDDEKQFVRALVGPKLPNGCQPWLGSPNFGELQPQVYGQISLRRYPWVATRIVYTIWSAPSLSTASSTTRAATPRVSIQNTWSRAVKARTASVKDHAAVHG